MKCFIVFLSIFISLINNDLNAETLEFPIIKSGSKTYVSGSLNLVPKNELKELSLVNSFLDEFISSYKKNKEMKDFYYPIDGSRLNYEASIEDNSESLYSIIDSFRINRIVKFGNFKLVDVNYAVKGKGDLPWREDLACKEKKCYVSVVFAEDEHNQLFELSYMKLIGYNHKKTSRAEGLPLKKDSLRFLPKGKSDSNNPLLVNFSYDERDVELCFEGCNQNKPTEQKSNYIAQIVERFINGLQELDAEKEEELSYFLSTNTSKYTKNLAYPILRWSNGEPSLISVNESIYATYISKVRKVKIFGSIESDKKVYLLSSFYIERQDGSEENNLEIITLDKQDDYKISINSAGDFDYSFLYNIHILEYLWKLYSDLL